MYVCVYVCVCVCVCVCVFVCVCETMTISMISEGFHSVPEACLGWIDDIC